MALVIVSGGALTHSRLRTITLRTLALSVGGLTLAGLLGGLALGFLLGITARPGQDGAQPSALSGLDPARPDDRAIIQQIGTLSGRMIQLEAAADRLAERVGATPSKTQARPEGETGSTGEPAGGPLLPTASGLRLVKRGKEAQGGDGSMAVVRAHVVSLEPLADDSKVLKAILDYEQQ